MKVKKTLGAAGLAAGGAAACWALTPGFMKSGAKGIAYGLGAHGLQLDGLGRFAASLTSHGDSPPVLAQMHEHVQYITKIPPKEFFLTNATRMVEAFDQVNAWYGMDLPVPFTDIYNYEAEALGAKMIYGDIDMPTIDFTDPLIKDISDIDRINTHLTPESGRMRYVIDAANAFKTVCGLPKIAVFAAPFSVAVGLRTYPKLIRDMRKDPKAAHELFTWITDEVHPRFIEVIRKETGARFALAADAWSCFPNLTHEMIEEWVIPYNTRVRKNALEQGMLLGLLASSDYCEERPERFNKEDMQTCWRQMTRSLLGNWTTKGAPLMGMGRTQDWPLEWLRDFGDEPIKYYGKRPVLVSFNARFLREGPVDVLVDFVKRTVDMLGREGRIIFLFAQIPAATPPEHVHAAVHAIRTYGKYPIAENLDDIKFKMPEFEPFDVWLKKR